MRAVIDARLGRKPTGIGNYVIALCREFGRIAPDYVQPICRFHQGRQFRRFGLRPAFPRWPGSLPSLPDTQVIHGPNFHAPPHPTAARVATIHDVSYLLLPDCHPPDMSARLDALVRAAIPSTAAFLCDSQYTLDSFLTAYPVDPARCHVVPLGVDTDRFHELPAAGEGMHLAQHYGLVHPFLLFVGGMAQRKDLLTLVRAFGSVADKLADAELVLAGNKMLRWASDWPRVADWLAQHPAIAKRVRVLNYVAPADIPALYRASRIVVLTSLIEGFGLTVLEGFASGRPVVATRSSALPEVGGTAAYYGEAGDPESFAAAIEAAWQGEDSTRRIVEARSIVAAHSWTRTASQTLEVYREAVA